MQNAPKIESRPALVYVGRRVVMPMSQFEETIPSLIAELAQSLGDEGITPAGPPFIRYHVIDMPDRMDVEVGMPIKSGSVASDRVSAAELPAGRYAVLTYTGVSNGIAANKTLVDWIADQDEEVVSHKSENGDVFKSRFETFLTDGQTEPDQDKWETEIAIKLRDKS